MKPLPVPPSPNLPTLPAHSLMCGEVWSANSNVAHTVDLPGLRAWVYSAPLELGHNGGDIHYLSSCNYGILSRIALADVSGHGQAVSGVADRLLCVMRTHINEVDQRQILCEVGDSLREINDSEHMTLATALLLGFDSSSGDAVFTNAGHPPPLWYHADSQRWEWLQPGTADRSEAFVNLPLGTDFDSSYTDVLIQMGQEDLLIFYSDGLSEACDTAGRQIDNDALMELAKMLPVQTPMAAGATLLGLIDAWRRGAPASDDETLIVLRRQKP